MPSDFENAVNEARNKLGGAEFDAAVGNAEGKKPEAPLKVLPFKKRGKKAYCLVDGLIDTETWPSEFDEIPSKGDYIESRDGRRLEVLNIVYKDSDEGIQTILELGKSRTSVTPTEASGPQQEDW